MAAYIALVRKEKGTSYGVDFPDFPGCVAAGKTLDEAWRNARESLVLHLDGLAEDGEVVPEPSSLETVMADMHNRDATAVIVPAPVAKGRTVRINVTMDENLLRDIDAAAGEGGRSAFLAEAAKDRLTVSGLQKIRWKAILDVVDREGQSGRLGRSPSVKSKPRNKKRA